MHENVRAHQFFYIYNIIYVFDSGVFWVALPYCVTLCAMFIVENCRQLGICGSHDDDSSTGWITTAFNNHTHNFETYTILSIMYTETNRSKKWRKKHQFIRKHKLQANILFLIQVRKSTLVSIYFVRTVYCYMCECVRVCVCFRLDLVKLNLGGSDFRALSTQSEIWKLKPIPAISVSMHNVV